MIKIVNGKIVREGVVGVTGTNGSPVVTRRRCSIQDLQLKEYEQQVLQTQQPGSPPSATPKDPPSWTEIFQQEIVVFGLHINVLKLTILSILMLFFGGLTGLLVALMAVYIGTLFKSPQRTAATPNGGEKIGSPASDRAFFRPPIRSSPLASSM